MGEILDYEIVMLSAKLRHILGWQGFDIETQWLSESESREGRSHCWDPSAQKSFDTLDNTITVGQVPTKVCQMEEVPLCAKHEVAETKKVKPNADLFDSSRFYTLSWIGVQGRPNWGVPRHWGKVHPTILWLQCEFKSFCDQARILKMLVLCRALHPPVTTVWSYSSP